MESKRTKYKTAREMSCNPQTGKRYTQEEAAEKLFTSVTTIKCIESDERKCSADMAEAMAELYNAPWVADPTTPIDYVPLPRTEAAMKFLKERNDVNRVMERATEILADGIVDESEAEDFKIVTKEISGERDAARDLLYAI